MALAPRRLRARVGVRVASALSAAAVVAVALLIGGAALVLLVDRSLTASVKADAEQRASAIATRLHGNYGKRVSLDGDDPVYTPKENAVEALDALARGDDQIAQVLVDYSENDDGSYLLTRASSASSEVVMSTMRPAPGQSDVESGIMVRDAQGGVHHVVVAAAGGITTTPDPVNFVVLYAGSLAPVDAARDTVLKGLLLGVPFLILIAGAATYVFAGRALRPVEAMRVQVASMSEKDLSQRVPVPAARDEIGRLAETMNGMIARLEDAQGAQRRFVADASHELRSPLATIGAGLELLQDETVDQRTVGAMRGETERLGRLVDDLLLLARADERGIRPREEEVDLDEVADAERTRPTDGSVATEVHAEHVRVVGDRSQLVRVLRNLVDNAHRHARTRVLVTLTREGDEAVLEVADDGPGVPEADRGRVFERFVRLDDARSRADGGSGLGLAIVAEVVAAHGGSVDIEDADGGGALFRVRLPVLVEPEADDGDFPVDEPAVTADPPAQPWQAAPPSPTPSSPTPSGPAVLSSPAALSSPPVPGSAGPVAAPTRPTGARHRAPDPIATAGPDEPEVASRPVPRPRRASPARLPVERPTAVGARGGFAPAPVTDVEARRDPETSPWGIPQSAETAPHGIPVTVDARSAP